jgi:hypothetical protein
MPVIIRNTPAGLIPKELFSKEKTQEFWNILFPNHYQEIIGVDKLEEFFLLYPKSKDVETQHHISILYQNINEKFPHQKQAMGFDGSENSFNVLLLKDMNIVFAGFFTFSVYEDIVYYLANVSQHFFDNISQITIYYQQINSKIWSLLNQYFELKQIF